MAVALLLYVGLKVWIAVVCFKKGKQVFGMLGIISIVFPFIIGWFAIVGSIRLAKPDSDWATENYELNGPKMAGAIARFPENAPKVALETASAYRPTKVPKRWRSYVDTQDHSGTAHRDGFCEVEGEVFLSGLDQICPLCEGPLKD